MIRQICVPIDLCQWRFYDTRSCTVKKIPSMLLGKCEFGRDDYSLNIVDMPRNPDEPEFVPSGPPVVEAKKEEMKVKAEQSGQLNIFSHTD